VLRFLSVCGKKTSSELWPLSAHEPVKLLFLGHTRHKIYNNIPRIEDNLKENIQRVMPSASAPAGRLAMDRVIIRHDCKPKDTNSNTFFKVVCTKNVIVIGMYKTGKCRPRLVAKWKSGYLCAPFRQSSRKVASLSLCVRFNNTITQNADCYADRSHQTRLLYFSPLRRESLAL
jgi:hypothetical protein